MKKLLPFFSALIALLPAATAAHNYADGICTVCGAKDPEYTGAVGTETESTPLPDRQMPHSG